MFFRYLFLSLPLMAWAITLKAQFSDSFCDGDFTHDPQWVGTTEKFVVENQMLRLMDETAGEAWLSTASSLAMDVCWEFWVRLGFTPSDNNTARIYVLSDQADLLSPLNGYYLQLGKTGTGNKRLFLYRQQGSSHHLVFEGTGHHLPASNNQIRIRLNRDAWGEWTLWVDPRGNGMFFPDAQGFDNVFQGGTWFGLYARYTQSNASSFYFDDLSAGPIPLDTLPPGLIAIRVEDAWSLSLEFDKALEPHSSQQVLNYRLEPSGQHPLLAILSEEQANRVNLHFAQPMQPNMPYVLHYSGIGDYSGNHTGPLTHDFWYYVPARFDVVFNEIMADPQPQVGLPAHEYIELYNTRPYAVDMHGWVLQHGNTRRHIPSVSIPAGGYLLLTTEAAAPYFEEFGQVCGIPWLSATALTNAGTLLQLFDADDSLVSFVSYSDRWYRDPSKNQGGWSLEKIDPYNFCGGQDNWMASASYQGGTPGQENAVRAENPDTLSPFLLRASYPGNGGFGLHFSEPMTAESLMDAQAYRIEPGLGILQEWYTEPPFHNELMLKWEFAPSPGQIYRIDVDGRAEDCAGNIMPSQWVRAALPSYPDSAGLVFNELLFHPPEQGSRYIELFHNAHRVYDLKDLRIAEWDSVAGIVGTALPLSSGSFLVFPGDYVLLSSDLRGVKMHYDVPLGLCVPDMPGFPPMRVSRGGLALADRSLSLLDAMVYDEDMHHPMLLSRRGVALERLNAGWSSMMPSNWHSAAGEAGFGTPGRANSQQAIAWQGGRANFQVYPRVFSPGAGGSDELLQIRYDLTEPGFMAHVRVFDRAGRQIRVLQQGLLMGSSGVITWDGLCENRLRTAPGIYLIWVSLIHPDGKLETHRLPAVLAGSRN